MTLGMTIAIIVALIFGFVQIFRWTFSEPSHVEFIGPYGADEDDEEDDDGEA